MQTTGIISDVTLDQEQEEMELTDAGLSPIQADDLPIPDEVGQFADVGTSPIGPFAPVSHVDTSDATTVTDNIDTKDASNSPIRPEEPYAVIDKRLVIKDDVEILQKRRGSGDVKAKVQMLENAVLKPIISADSLRKKQKS